MPSQYEQVELERLRKKITTGSGTATWGSITGTLSNQTDLQSELDAKQDEPSEGPFADGDKTKLDGIESGATADQTGAEIKTAYEAEADTNAFDDAAVSKLAGIEAGATADQTGAEIKTAYEAEADTNAFTDADHTKLDGIATGAEVNPDVVSQAEAEAGTATTERIWTAQRVAQAIAALETGGGTAPEYAWQSMAGWIVEGSGPAFGSISASRRILHVLYDASTQETGHVPCDGLVDWVLRNSSTVDLYLWTMTISATTTNTARMWIILYESADTESGDTQIGSWSTVDVTVPGTSNTRTRTQIASGASVSSITDPSAMSWFIRRVAADAADTYTDDIAVIGIEVVKAS